MGEREGLGWGYPVLVLADGPGGGGAMGGTVVLAGLPSPPMVNKLKRLPSRRSTYAGGNKKTSYIPTIIKV